MVQQTGVLVLDLLVAMQYWAIHAAKLYFHFLNCNMIWLMFLKHHDLFAIKFHLPIIGKLLVR